MFSNSFFILFFFRLSKICVTNRYSNQFYKPCGLSRWRWWWTIEKPLKGQIKPHAFLYIVYSWQTHMFIHLLEINHGRKSMKIDRRSINREDWLIDVITICRDLWIFNVNRWKVKFDMLALGSSTMETEMACKMIFIQTFSKSSPACIHIIHSQTMWKLFKFSHMNSKIFRDQNNICRSINN